MWPLAVGDFSEYKSQTLPLTSQAVRAYTKRFANTHALRYKRAHKARMYVCTYNECNDTNGGRGTRRMLGRIVCSLLENANMLTQCYSSELSWLCCKIHTHCVCCVYCGGNGGVTMGSHTKRNQYHFTSFVM